MAKLRSVKLKEIKDLGAIQFVNADWREDSRIAIIHYLVNGRPQDFGLRIDLDKKTILDQDVLREESRIQLSEEVIQQRTNEIWEIIAKARSKEFVH